MDKPEEKKPSPGAGQPPRPPIGGKKGDAKPPLPGQKPGLPGFKPSAPGLPGTPPVSGLPGKPSMSLPGMPGGSKPPQAGNTLGPIKPPLGAGRPPMLPGTPPAAGPGLPPHVEKGLSDAEGSSGELQQKVVELEKRLAEEREKVLLASLRSKEEEALSAKVETSIKDIQDKLRREKKEQEMEESRRKAEARVLEMERRLAEEREAWVQTLKTQLTQRDQVTQEMESHFSSRLKDLEHRWGQEKSSLESTLKERENELARVRQEMGVKTEQERGFWEDRLRAVTLEKEKIDRELERLKDKAQQDKDQLATERQMLRDQVARLEANMRMLEDQHRLERANLVREHETIVNGLKQQMTLDHDQMGKQIGSLNLQAQNQSKDLIEKVGQLDALRGQLAALGVQFEQVNTRLNDRERTIDALKGRLQDTQVENERLQVAANNAQQQRREAENQMEEIRVLLRNRETQLEEARRLKAEAEEALKSDNHRHDDDIERLKVKLSKDQAAHREEIHQLQVEYQDRIQALHARLEPYEINASKAYSEARDKVRQEIEALEKQLKEANLKIEDLSHADQNHAQLEEQIKAMKAQLEEAHQEGKQIQWNLEGQVKALQDEVRLSAARLQQAEELRSAVEQELKQKTDTRALDQQLLTDREREIERLTTNFEAVKKAFEAQKSKIPGYLQEIEELKKVVQEKGHQTQSEFQARLQEKEKEIERLQKATRDMKALEQEKEKLEDLYREKERVLRTSADDKEATLNEFKNRVHQLERRIDEFSAEREEAKDMAKKDMERLIQAKDREMTERLEVEKEAVKKSMQEDIEKIKFRAAQEAVEKVRAEMPTVTENPGLIRQEVERQYLNEMREKEDEFERKLKDATAEQKKEADKFRWENESLKEELKKAREARLQIEKEAQDLLQQADDHYRNQLITKTGEIQEKSEKSRGFFTAIGSILDTPLFDFNKKKPEEPKS